MKQDKRPLERRLMRRQDFLRASLMIAVVFTLLQGPAGSQTGPSEYTVKGAFLLQFARFVDWPTSSLPNGAALEIAVFGTDGCFKQIETSIGSKTLDGRKVVVKQVHTAKAAETVHVLFVPRSAMGRMSELASLRGKPVLIVGESSSFTRQNGHVGFVLDKSRLGFEINASSAKGSGLVVSSKLLQLARRVD